MAGFGFPRRVVLTVIAAVFASIGGFAAVGVVVARGQFGSAGAGTSGPTLPVEFAGRQPKPTTVTSQPAGPAVAAYLTDDDSKAWWIFVGANRRAQRRVDVGAYRGTNDNAHSALLAPDGGSAALALVPSPDDEQPALTRRPFSVSVVDLRSGSRRPISELRLSDDDRLLAWSPDATRLAVRVNGKLTIVNVRSGERTSLDTAVVDAAFSPTGDRIAASAGGTLTVMSTGGGRAVASTAVGSLTVARAGWSPDGASIALRSETEVARLEVGSMKVVARVNTSAFMPHGWSDSATLVGTRSDDGRPIRGAFRPSSTRTETPLLQGNERIASLAFDSGKVDDLARPGNPLFGRVEHVQLASGLVPGLVIAPAGRVDTGAPWIWYCLVVAGVVAGAVVGHRWTSVTAASRATDDIAWLRTALAQIGGITLVALTPIIYLFAEMSRRSDIFTEYVALVSLSAAAIAAGLATRPTRAAATTYRDRLRASASP